MPWPHWDQRPSVGPGRGYSAAYTPRGPEGASRSNVTASASTNGAPGGLPQLPESACCVAGATGVVVVSAAVVAGFEVERREVVWAVVPGESLSDAPAVHAAASRARRTTPMIFMIPPTRGLRCFDVTEGRCHRRARYLGGQCSESRLDDL